MEMWLSVGAFPCVSLADARRLKDWARASLAKGEDHGAENQDRKPAKRNRSGATFTSQTDAFIEKARKEGRAESTVDQTEWLIGMMLYAFFSKPITEVTTQTIRDCHRRVEAWVACRRGDLFLGYESLLSTYSAYLPVSLERPAELIRMPR